MVKLAVASNAVRTPLKAEKGTARLVVDRTWQVLPEPLFQFSTLLLFMLATGIQAGSTKATPALPAAAPSMPALLMALTVA